MVKAPAPTYVGPATHQGSRTNRPIKRIVIHCTAGAEPGQKNAARNTVTYSKRTTRPSSYHYIRDAFEALQYVYDSWVAYHAPPNKGSIGYELCCSLSNEGKGHWEREDHQVMLREAAKDVARLCIDLKIPAVRRRAVGLRLGRKGLCGHVDVSSAWGQTSHWDPGPYFPWKAFLRMVRAEIRLLKETGDKYGGKKGVPEEGPGTSERSTAAAAEEQTKGRRADIIIRNARAMKGQKGKRGRAARATLAAFKKVPFFKGGK